MYLNNHNVLIMIGVELEIDECRFDIHIFRFK